MRYSLLKKEITEQKEEAIFSVVRTVAAALSML